MGLTASVPVSAFVPVQPTVAVQLVAFELLQVRVLVAPAAILAGAADRDTVGGAGGVTMTVVVACALPPAPVHVRR